MSSDQGEDQEIRPVQGDSLSDSLHLEGDSISVFRLLMHQKL